MACLTIFCLSQLEEYRKGTEICSSQSDKLKNIQLFKPCKKLCAFKLLCIYKARQKNSNSGTEQLFWHETYISVIMIMAHYAYSDVLGMKKLIDDPLFFSVNIYLSHV
jgi:hypothetical protein